jgi:hypothetical protein
MRGRRPAGPEYVDQLDGSALAKERLQVVLQTLAGQCRLGEACARLAMSEQRFHQIREEALRAAVAALEPKPAGRPAAATAASPQHQALQQQLEQLQVELQAARLREEIALTLPQHSNAASEQLDPEKKTRRRQRNQAARPHNHPARKRT